MSARKALPVQLSAEQERELNDLVRAHSIPRKLAERATEHAREGRLV